MSQPWRIVGASALALTMSIGTLAVYSFSLFVKPLSEEFHWTRAQVSLATTLTNLGVAAVMPAIGFLTDRYGSRVVALVSHLLLGLGLCSMSLMGGQLWQLYAAYLCMGLGGAGSTPLPYSRLTAKWFDRQRGLALGIVMSGVGLGSFIVPQIVRESMELWGWRGAYVVMGILAVVVPGPLIALFLNEPPVSRQAGQALPSGLTRGEALRTWIFWQMTGVFFLVAVCSYGAISHLSPILTDRGVSVYDATMAVSVFGASALVGRVVTGWLVDRIFAPFVAAGMFAAMGIGLVLLHQGLAGAVAAGLIGVGLGAEVDVMPYLFSRYFGFRAFGEIYGITYSVFAIGFASGPYLMGIGFDLSGGYGLPLLVLMAVLAVAVVGMALLPRFDEALPDPA